MSSITSVKVILTYIHHASYCHVLTKPNMIFLKGIWGNPDKS